MSKSPKRPRDLNQWAKRMVDIATGDASDRKPTPEEHARSRYKSSPSSAEGIKC
jgi:hypothetical protein